MEKDPGAEGKRVTDYGMILAGGISRVSASVHSPGQRREGKRRLITLHAERAYTGSDREATGEDTMTHKRKVQDNALKAVLRTPMFKQRVVKARKGKGSYQRQGKSQGNRGGSEAPSVSVHDAA